MKVIFTCGGTAGHVNPALALAQYMQERIENLDILFVGTPDGMERGLVEQAGYAFRGVEVGGFCRSLAPSGIRHNLKSVEHLLAAKGRVRAILRDFPADLVVGTGGYASYPITKYAAQHGIPTAVHESNASWWALRSAASTISTRRRSSSRVRPCAGTSSRSRARRRARSSA